MAKLLWSITIAIGDLGGIMRSWWSEPYLWVHLAGIAAVPICLELCLLGLAASEARFPPLLVMLLVAVVGIAPIVWMQWQRPFYIFSLLPLVLKPAQLTENQRRVLRRFKAPLGRVLTLTMAIVSIVLLWKLQQWVPSTMPMAQKIVSWGSIGGLLLAMGAFLMSNLFLQVPASVLAVLVTPEALLRKAEPYPVTSISSDFSLLGIPVKQILPPITEPPAATPIQPPSPAAPSPSGSAVADRATQASEPEAAELESVSASVEPAVVSDAPETTVDLETETAPTPEISAEPEVVVNLEPETEPDDELGEETETALETPFEAEADTAPESKLSSEPETHLESETHLEPETSPETSPEPEAEPEAEPEFTAATEETNWDDEETNWNEPETEPTKSVPPIVSASGIIEAERVERPIEAETVRDADTENAEAPIEMLATLERPIEISARLEDPEDPIEAVALENPFEEAASELPQISEKTGLPTVQDTVVTIIPETHLPDLELEPNPPTELLPAPERNHTVENTIVMIIPNTNSGAELPPEENV